MDTIPLTVWEKLREVEIVLITGLNIINELKEELNNDNTIKLNVCAAHGFGMSSCALSMEKQINEILGGKHGKEKESR